MSSVVNMENGGPGRRRDGPASPPVCVTDVEDHSAPDLITGYLGGSVGAG